MRADLRIHTRIQQRLFFLIAGLLAMLIRAELITPQLNLVDRVYNGLLTVHGTMMIFLWVIPCLAGSRNYLIPSMIMAQDIAFPVLNAIAFWSYPPISLQQVAGYRLNGELIWILSVLLIGIF